MRKTAKIDWLGNGTGDSSQAEARRFLKRQASKARRRLGKKLLDDAPRRVTRDYWD